MTTEKLKFIRQALCRIEPDSIVEFSHHAWVGASTDQSNFNDFKTDEITGFEMTLSTKINEPSKITIKTK